MAGMDDLDFDDLISDAINMTDAPMDDDERAGEDDPLGDEAETQKFQKDKLFRPQGRKALKTPVLSGRKMASESSTTLPIADDGAVESSTEPSGDKVAGPKKKKRKSSSQPGQMSFDHIYRRAGLKKEDGFTVFRIEELLSDSEMADLDDHARVVAIRAILKSHGVAIEDVFDDAVARREALDSHDARLKSNIARVEQEIDDENTQLQNEIEEFATPRIAKMEANNDRLERLRRDYRDWHARKATEQERLVEILEPWGGDDRLRQTEKVEAIGSEQKDTLPTAAVSADEVFEKPSPAESRRSSPSARPQDDASSALPPEEWSLGAEDDDEEVGGREREPSVKTDLPSDFSPAADEEPDLTGEFSFQQARLRTPRTPIQGIVAAFAVVLWFVGGLLVAIQLPIVLEAFAALGVAFGAPIVIALVGSFATRRTGNWWTGFFALLFYLGLAWFVGAHFVDSRLLVTQATSEPRQVVEEAGLSRDVDAALDRFLRPYAHLVAGPLGVEDAIVFPAKETGTADSPTEDAASPGSEAP